MACKAIGSEKNGKLIWERCFIFIQIFHLCLKKKFLFEWFLSWNALDSVKLEMIFIIAYYSNELDCFFIQTIDWLL